MANDKLTNKDMHANHETEGRKPAPNPFEEQPVQAANSEANAEEEAETEQQRKEAMSERD